MELVTTKEGYLIDWQNWDEAIAQQLAQHENLVLSEDHWLIVNFLRNFYQHYHIVPAMRVLIKELAPRLPTEKSNSIYLQKLFPRGLFLQGCKIAGLPKPARCI